MSENENCKFVCEDCGYEHGNYIPLDEELGVPEVGDCYMCDHFGDVYDTKLFFRSSTVVIDQAVS